MNWEPIKRDYPHQYKQYKVLEKMKDDGSIRYTDVVRLAFELSHGKGSYDKDTIPTKTMYHGDIHKYRVGGNPNRGYWSGAFQRIRDYYYGEWDEKGWMLRLADKGDDGKYRINDKGMEVYQKLHKKYKGITPEKAKEMQQK